MTDYLYVVDNAIAVAVTLPALMLPCAPPCRTWRRPAPCSLPPYGASRSPWMTPNTSPRHGPRHTLLGRHDTLIHKVLDEIPHPKTKRG